MFDILRNFVKVRNVIERTTILDVRHLVDKTHLDFVIYAYWSHLCIDSYPHSRRIDTNTDAALFSGLKEHRKGT